MLADHHAIVRTGLARHGGREVGQPTGDGFFAAFGSAAGAAAAAVDVQRDLAEHRWPPGAPVRVRMGIHCGEVIETAGGLVGVDVHRAARIAAAAHGGQVVLSAEVTAQVAGALPEGAWMEDLGEHRLRDLGAPVRLWQLHALARDEPFPPLRTLDAVRHNLPVELSSFVGRERELAALADRLAADRLLTLLGPGGVGKSRLAVQVGADTAHRYPGGAWMVALAPIGRDDLVQAAAAAALGLREDPLRPLPEQLVDRLCGEPTLVVLDNCEHVIEGAAALAAHLVRRCPSLTILATSIEPLRVPGEAVFAVEPLPVGPAVRLFFDRAAAVDPSFVADDTTAATVARVCERLDGLPLAIELAAARAATLTPEQLDARLDDRFALLRGGARTADRRHRTLRSVVDWSVDLLNPVERTVLEQLSVFRGGLTLEAAEAVVDTGGAAPGEVLDALSRLVDRSLVMARGRGVERRYSLLETIRSYGRDQLAAAGRLDEARDRHLAWAAQLASESVGPGGGQVGWMDRLQRELDNLRAALEWSASSPDRARHGLGIASRLLPLWMARGLRYEGIGWVERLVRVADVRPASRLRALLAASTLAAFSWPASMASLARTADELAGDDPDARAAAAVLWAGHELFAGHLEACRLRAKQAHELVAAGLGGGLAATWLAFVEAMTVMAGDPAGGLVAVEACEASSVAAGDVHTAGAYRILVALGRHVAGDEAGARRDLAEARRTAEEFRCSSCTSLNLTVGALMPDRPVAEREADAARALRLSDEIDETMTRVEALRALVRLAAEDGRHERVARLAGAVAALCRQSGYGMVLPGWRDAMDDAESAARRALGDEAYDGALRAGGAMGYPEVAALAAEPGVPAAG